MEGNASNEDSQVTDKYNSDSEEEEYARTCEDSRPDTMPHLSEEEDSDKENERIGKVKKKVGRKNQWEEEVVDDLFDIILENEDYKRKLLLTNTKSVERRMFKGSVNCAEKSMQCTRLHFAVRYCTNENKNKTLPKNMPPRCYDGKNGKRN